MNLRISTINNSRSRRNKVMSYLHQCKQCGVLFERIGKAAASATVGGFSWDKKFMVDKCDTCKSFGFCDIY
jgi:hypothetical protein